MKKKKFCQFIAFMGVAFTLIGCSQNTRPSEIVDKTAEKSTVVQSPIATEHNYSVETTYEYTPVDVTEEESSTDGTVSVYIGEPRRFTKDEINAFLNACGDSIVSSEESSGTSTNRYSGTCASGSYFLWDHNFLGHPYAVFQYANYNKFQTYNAYPFYKGAESYSTNKAYTVGWMFTEKKDFSFQNAKEAEQTVRNTLSTLGLPELVLLDTLYFDHKTMEQAVNLVATDERYAPVGSKVENNGYKIKDSWSEADDAYLFNFGISVHGIPMSYLNESRNTAMYSGSEIIVWYTHDGIISITIKTPWTVGEKVGNSEQIISEEKALEIAQEKYENILIYQNLSVEEARLTYQYVQDQERWLLYPIWEVKIGYNMEHSEDRYYEYMHVDAFTGAEF